MATNFCKARVYLQVACSGAWYDMSGEGAAVSIDGGEVAIGEEFVFNSDHPLVVGGKHGRINVTARATYTESAVETTELVRAVYESGCDRELCLRWIPLGATAGNKQYTTVSGILTSPVYPAGEAASADPTMIEVVVTCPNIDVADVV